MANHLTVGSVIANAARGTPDTIAAVISGQSHSFAELDAAGTNVAGHLVEQGLRPGDVALVFAPTSFALLAHYVGCARAGVVFAAANQGLDPATIAAIATKIEPAIVLAHPSLLDVATPLGAPTFWAPLEPPQSPQPLPNVTADEPHIAFFTSGSTGAPKAALLSHRASVLRSHPGSQLEPRGAALCPYPLFHMAGWTIGLQQWHARSSVVFVDGTDAETLVTVLRDHRIERFNAIPALWMRLAEHVNSGADADALRDLRFADTGTSPTSVELLQTIAGLAPNAHVRVFYGSSEAGNVASLHHDDLLTRPGSCGQPSVLTEVAIDPDTGELLVAGPLLFDGYLGDPEATQAAFADDWYRTGDRAELDADGFLSIVGRIGTVIRTGGESVAPEAVEEALRTFAPLDDVAIFGVPDERWGESVWAAVVATSPVSIDDLRAHLGPNGPHHLPNYQHPRRVLMLEELPRTAATGQIDRNRLRQLAQERLVT